MSWHIVGREMLTCPPEYQEYVDVIGGLNRFGESNFRIEWGETPIELVRGKDANGRSGQHMILKHGGIPAWFITTWKPPECFGTPDLWYATSWDEDSQTHTLGEFPYRGLYMPSSFNLFVRNVTGGGHRYSEPDAKGHRHVEEVPSRMDIEAMPLTFWLLDLIIPNMLKEIDVTYEQKRVALMNRKLAESAEARAKAYDAYMDAAPAFFGKAGTYESNREAWMQKLKEKAAGMKLTAEDVQKIMGKGHKVH
jgi:hypothetical protein